jgi:hypothetical protein
VLDFEPGVPGLLETLDELVPMTENLDFTLRPPIPSNLCKASTVASSSMRVQPSCAPRKRKCLTLGVIGLFSELCGPGPASLLWSERKFLPIAEWEESELDLEIAPSFSELLLCASDSQLLASDDDSDSEGGCDEGSFALRLRLLGSAKLWLVLNFEISRLPSKEGRSFCNPLFGETFVLLWI